MKEELTRAPLPTTALPETTTRIPSTPSYLRALDLQLVPQGPKMSSGPLPTIITDTNPSPMFLLDAQERKGAAEWSDWRPWNECFCDKQVRTRVCNYDSAFHSSGKLRFLVILTVINLDSTLRM